METESGRSIGSSHLEYRREFFRMTSSLSLSKVIPGGRKMEDFLLVDDQIQLIRHRIPDIDPGKSQSEDQRTPEYPDQDPAKRFFFIMAASSLSVSVQQYRRGDHPVTIETQIRPEKPPI